MILNRKQAPELQDISKIVLPNIQNLSLDNGIPLSVLNVGSQELLKIQFSFPAGTVYQNELLTALFTNDLLKEGSKNYTSMEIAEKLDFYGAFVDARITRDRAYVNVFSLNKYLDKVLKIVADFLIAPSLSAKELQIITAKEKQLFLIKMQKVKTIANRRFQQFIFGADHPYGYLANMTDYEAVDLDNIKKFFEANYQLKDWQLYVSGKVNDDTLSLLNRYFGFQELIGEKQEQKIIKQSFKTDNSHHFIEHKGAMQTALKMGQLTINRTHKDYPVLSLAQTILGGFFGSRLMQNIREDKGYTYGIGSSIMHLHHASVFVISSEVGGEVAEKALEEVMKEMKLLRSKIVAVEELQLVKNYMAGSLLKSLNGPFALGEMMRMLKEYHLSEDYFTHYISNIQEATAEEVLQTAQKYLNENDMMSLLVGSKKV